jgi:predicted NBD/HSP70 family sugar kinase
VDLGHYTIPVIVKNDCSLQAIATLWRYVKLAEKNRVGEPAFI